tara:strand:+ start:24 stop:410 length:387 start_codon:yes stop_codon:yes gene_type:complete
MRTFDIDGVICMGDWVGVRPSPCDVIITGRSFEEADETDDFLQSHNITNRVYYNPVKFEDKTRASSGEHKARIIKQLQERGENVRCHFEDDEVQAQVIEQETGLPVVLLMHNLVNKENVRRDANGNEV